MVVVAVVRAAFGPDVGSLVVGSLVVGSLVVGSLVVGPVLAGSVVVGVVVRGAAEAVDDVLDDVVVPHPGTGRPGQGEHDLGADRADGSVHPGAAQSAGDELGEGDDAVVGVLGGFFGQVEPTQLRGAGGGGAEGDPAVGDGGGAAGFGPGGVDRLGLGLDPFPQGCERQLGGGG